MMRLQRCRELEKLQDQANPQPFEDAKRVLEQQLGMVMEDAFSEFEPEARAAASLAQVLAFVGFAENPG